MTNLPPPSGAPVAVQPPSPPTPAWPPAPMLPPRPPLLHATRMAPALAPREDPITATAPVGPAERTVSRSSRNPLAAMPVVHHVRLPSGLTVRADAGPMRLVGSAGILTMLSYLVVLGTHVAIALDFGRRLAAAERRRGPVEVWSDHSVSLLVILAACYLVAMVATAWWTFRVSANNALLGAAGTAPLVGAGACLVPLAWFSTPFSQMRTSPRADTAVTLWQLAFVAPFLSAYFILRYFTRAERWERWRGGIGEATILREMQGAMLVSWAFVGSLAVAVVCAACAIWVLSRTYREIDTQWAVRLDAATLEAQST